MEASKYVLHMALISLFVLLSFKITIPHIIERYNERTNKTTNINNVIHNLFPRRNNITTQNGSLKENSKNVTKLSVVTVIKKPTGAS